MAVLAGSTEKMGVGTNVQDRAVALNHLDAPWRPADVSQRDGRIARQGNLKAEVKVIRWVTARSFDGYMWQTLERKARFIQDVMSPALDAREIGDVGDTVLSFNEAKALATGNPLLMDKAEADAALARLGRAERAHVRGQDALRHTIAWQEERIARLGELGAELDAAIARRQDTRGDRFVMTVGGRRHDKRAWAGMHLAGVLREAADGLDGRRQAEMRAGELGGFPLRARAERASDDAVITLELEGTAGADIVIYASELDEADPVSLVTRLEGRLRRLEERRATAAADAESARREIEHATAGLGRTFPQAGELAEARDRVRRIDAELTRMAEAARVSSEAVAEGSAVENQPAGRAADAEREAGQ